MVRKNHGFLFFALISTFLAVIVMSGCGGGVQTSNPNPSGFTNASLNGTYVFAISGTNGAGAFFAAAGVFTANGAGSITSGVEDVNDPGVAGVITNFPVTGTYAVRADGRTAVSINSSAGNFGLHFVLLSSQKGLAIEFDPGGTASGTVDMVNSAATTLSALAGSFAFNVSGSDGSGLPQNTAGLVTFDASGNIGSGGVLDDNDDGNVNGGTSIATPVSISASAGAISAPSNGRGTATISTSGSLAVVRHFAYYVIDANHLKLIETDGAPVLAGDAFRQTSTAVSGSFVFTLAGATGTGSTHQFFVQGGILNTDGAGNIGNNSVEDLDNGGAITPAGGAAVTGTYSVSGGRGTMVLTGAITQNVAFYPSSGGLQMIDLDAGQIVASGAALQQSGTFSNGSINNGFGLNFTGVVGPVVGGTEIDAVAQFNATGSGSLSGAIDVNNFGSTSTSLALNGSYTVAANGRGTAALRTSQGPMNFIFYMANNGQILFVELDESIGQIAVGTFGAQSK